MQTRRVRVFEEQPGADELVGQAVTNRFGRYTVSDPDAHGRFYARALRKEIHRLGGQVNRVCKKARSETILVRTHG